MPGTRLSVLVTEQKGQQELNNDERSKRKLARKGEVPQSSLGDLGSCCPSSELKI